MQEVALSTLSTTVAARVPARRKASWWNRLVAWSLLALLLFLVWRVYDIVLNGNFHTVLAGQCYRGAQPSAADLNRIAQHHGVRTVINLRGLQEDEVEEAWYPIEIQTAQTLGIKLVHIGLWSYTPPEVPEFHKLVISLAEDPAPFFIHCHSGSDRTGLATALFLLLRSDATLAQARSQLSLYYGHFPWGRAACHDRVLDCYERWLDRIGQQHSPQLLRQWALEVYDEHVDPPAEN